MLALLVAAAPGSAPADGPTWTQAVEVAAGPGTKGPWQQNDSRYDYVDDATVAIGPGGELVVAWVDQAKKDVFLRRTEGAPVNVSRSPATFSWLPRVAFSPHDASQVHVLWQEIIFSGGSHGGDMLYARSTDGGRTFEAPLNLSASSAGDGKGRTSRENWDNGSFDLAVGADGAVYAAWTQYEGALHLSVSPDAGRTFSAPRRVAGDPHRPARGPSLAIAPDRTLYLAWTYGEDPAADVYLVRSTDGGASFSAPQAPVRSRAYSDAPKVAVDARGVLHLAYAEGERIFYLRSSDGARTFEPPRTVSGTRAGFPFLGVGPDGVVCIAWERFPERRARPRGLGFALSRDGGSSFTPPAQVAASAAADGASNGSRQGLLASKLAVGPGGELALANSSLKPGTGSRVWLVRGAL